MHATVQTGEEGKDILGNEKAKSFMFVSASDCKLITPWKEVVPQPVVQ